MSGPRRRTDRLTRKGSKALAVESKEWRGFRGRFVATRPRRSRVTCVSRPPSTASRRRSRDSGAHSIWQARFREWRPSATAGALTLHALRLKLGDRAFLDVLREWSSRHRLANAGTEDLVVVAEEMRGLELSAFFDEWLFEDGGLPELP